MIARPPSFYTHPLKSTLPAAVWRPAPWRLAWLPVHVAVIAVATIAIARRWLPWPAMPALSLAIGLAFAGMLFVGHELMHGAILRGRRTRLLVGGVCFAPLVVSPHLWAAWHNQMHHGNANRIGADPDMYPSLASYRDHRAARFAIDHFALGGRRWRGLLSLVLGFTVQSVEILWTARACLHVSGRAHRRMIVETLVALAGWIALAVVLGPLAFAFAFVLPLLVANTVVMSFILTNHSLCPATDVNDPLLGALSVTTPRWVEWLTLDFGYHVEHHLFPRVSGAHARTIRAALLARWPERYRAMPLVAALVRMFQTGRVYRDATTLVDPRTGGEWTLDRGEDRHARSDEASGSLSSRRGCDVSRVRPACLAERVDGHAEHDRIAHGLDELHGQLDQAATEQAVGGADAVGDVLAKLDADRLDPPGAGVEEDRPQRPDGLPVRADHGPSV